jgi:hypothetical protein
MNDSIQKSCHILYVKRTNFDQNSDELIIEQYVGEETEQEKKRKRRRRRQK